MIGSKTNISDGPGTCEPLVLYKSDSYPWFLNPTSKHVTSTSRIAAAPYPGGWAPAPDADILEGILQLPRAHDPASGDDHCNADVFVKGCPDFCLC